MRTFTFIILSLFTVSLVGQESFRLRGKVTDAETGDPLSFATIYYPAKKLGTTSNSLGEFNFYIPNGNAQDEIVISYLGFKQSYILIDEFFQGGTYPLIPAITKLSDVTVSAKNKKFNAKATLKEAIKNFNKAKNKDTHLAYAQYREAAFKDGETLMFTEANGYSIFANTSGWARYANYKFINEETRAYTSNSKWVAYGQNNPGQTKKGVYSSGGSILRAYRVLEEEGLFSSDNLKKYSVKLDSTFDSSVGRIYAFRFKSGFDEGTIHVDQTTLRILKIEYSTKNFFSNTFFNSLRAKVILRFNYLESTPYIISGFSSYEKEGLTHVTELNILTQKNQSINIDDFTLGVINIYSNNPIIAYNNSNWTNDQVIFERAFCEVCLAINPASYVEDFMEKNGQLLVSANSDTKLNKNKEFLAIKSLINQLK